MSLETTVFTFKISVPFKEWAEVYDSQENIKMNKALQALESLKKKKDCPFSRLRKRHWEYQKLRFSISYSRFPPPQKRNNRKLNRKLIGNKK